MAMIKCPECKQSISDRANFCPHCGVPFVENRDIPIRKYKLRIGTLTDNSVSSLFFRVIGIIFLIGGLIISIVSANQSVPSMYGYGRSENSFSLTLFFATFVPYVLYSILSFVIGSLIEKFADRHDVICGLQLENDTESVSQKRISIDRIVQEENEKAKKEEALRQEKLEKDAETEVIKAIEACVPKAAEKEKSFLNLLKTIKSFKSVKAAWNNTTLNYSYPDIDAIIQENEQKKSWTNQEVRELKNSIVKVMKQYDFNESVKTMRVYTPSEANTITGLIANKNFSKVDNGFSIEEVDLYLDAICDEIENTAKDPDGTKRKLTKNNVKNKQFSISENGYDQEEVQHYLEELTQYFIDD